MTAPAAGAVLPGNGEPKFCGGCNPPLLPGRGVVMGAPGMPGAITITPIYWAPAGYSFPAAYTAVINQYVTDIAAASGALDNVYSIDTEYSSIRYTIAAGDPVGDAKPFTRDCTPDTGFTACVGDAQIQREVAAVVAANGLPADLAHLYPVFFPPHVETSMQGQKGLEKSKSDFCAYHSATATTNPVVYGVEPYADNCPNGQNPNRAIGGTDPAAVAASTAGDSAADTLSHEVMESITDPTQAGWTDSVGNENGDMCNSNYGIPLGSVDPNNTDTTRFNQVINGDMYYTQNNFSNTLFGTDGAYTGCAQSESQVQAGATGALRTGAARASAAATKAPPEGLSPGAGLNAVIVEAASHELPTPGSTTPITVTVVNDQGDPVTGDDVTFRLGTARGTDGTCGTLSQPGGTTNADGMLTLTYTSSAANVACDVIAIEGASGQSDQTQIEQGTAAQTAPRLEASLPASLTAGGPPVTFTAVASNPSVDPLPHARIDVIVTDSSMQGVRADQLHLAYASSATHGQFVAVPLIGSTAANDQIEGVLPSEVGTTIPAQGHETFVLRLSLDAGVPSTAATGNRLQPELDLSQVNPGDGSATVLDAVTGEVAIQAPASRTTLVCSPATVAVGEASTCQATVTGASHPSGSVSFTSDSSGSFSATSCTLAPIGGNQAACRVTYTPRAVGSGSHRIVARYSGDALDAASSAATTVTVPVGPSTTTVVCAPASVRVGQTSTCAATVTGGTHPTGTVTFASNSSGTFSAASCALALIGGNQARCSVGYTPRAVGSGTHVVYADYSGDAGSPPSHGSATITVTP